MATKWLLLSIVTSRRMCAFWHVSGGYGWNDRTISPIFILPQARNQNYSLVGGCDGLWYIQRYIWNQRCRGKGFHIIPCTIWLQQYVATEFKITLREYSKKLVRLTYSVDQIYQLCQYQRHYIGSYHPSHWHCRVHCCSGLFIASISNTESIIVLFPPSDRYLVILC